MDGKLRRELLFEEGIQKKGFSATLSLNISENGSRRGVGGGKGRSGIGGCRY